MTYFVLRPTCSKNPETSSGDANTGCAEDILGSRRKVNCK
jgi:hypothetical protein